MKIRANIQNPKYSIEKSSFQDSWSYIYFKTDLNEVVIL